MILKFQVVELDFLYPSEGIHRRWDYGYRITATAATWDQAAFVLSVPKRKPADETQETLRTSAFPSTHVKVLSFFFFFFHSSSELIFGNVFKIFLEAYFVMGLAGEVGEESLSCICLLWTNSFVITCADILPCSHCLLSNWDTLVFRSGCVQA
jgi:hypothetical protein